MAEGGRGRPALTKVGRPRIIKSPAEANLHLRFRRCRHHGEWFYLAEKDVWDLVLDQRNELLPEMIQAFERDVEGLQQWCVVELERRKLAGQVGDAE